MRKKLDTRFPAARIKKIMQADEDVGKIAMAVPLLVSKALELFLQDLCDRTYEVTLKRGAKTMNSLHLKQCVQSFNVFDFLRDIVGKVPDLGGSDTAGEDRSAAKRRKVVDEDDNDSEEESRKCRMTEAGHNSSSSRRERGRGRGRGRGRSSRTKERETTLQFEKSEDDPEIPKHQSESFETQDNMAEEDEAKVSVPRDKNIELPVRNFDLNVDLNENGDSAAIADSPPIKKLTAEVKHEEYLGWSLYGMEKIAIDPLQLAELSSRIDEEEDYDEG